MVKSLSVSECQTHKKGHHRMHGFGAQLLFFLLFAVCSFFNSNEVLFRINSGVDFDFEFEKPGECEGLEFQRAMPRVEILKCI